MLSIATTALTAIPATHLISKLAGTVADAGHDFLHSLNDPQTEKDSLDVSASAAKKPTGTGTPSQPASLAELLKSIQSLIANLSDDASDTVIIESLSESEVSVTGDEPLASSIKEWTKLHPEWVQDWYSHQSSGTRDAGRRNTNLSAAITAISVRFNAPVASD